VPYGLPVADLAGGMLAAIAILARAGRARRAGQGCTLIWP
jgi:crotonobetainyl-CoA:carnitine CoA-transferase CaiB-like acyl-CoA transferase